MLFLFFLILLCSQFLFTYSLTPLSECTQGRITAYTGYENGGSCDFGIPKMYGAAPTMRLDANGTSTTRLECETALSIANGRDFFIAMPHATYTALQINVYDEDNNVIATKTLKAGKSIQIHRSQVTNINLSL